MEKKRILLVDDEKAIRISLASALKYFNYEVDLAENGIQAINLINRMSYDLVISDYKMPGMDGLELTREIRLKYPFTPVLIITGTESAYESLESEATACFSKPLDVFELHNCIMKILSENQ